VERGTSVYPIPIHHYLHWMTEITMQGMQCVFVVDLLTVTDLHLI